MDTEIFLKRVLSDEGLYCSFSFRTSDEHRTQNFYPTIEELVEKSIETDNKGYDAYYALATFEEAGSRKVDNVKKLKSFFLDLDCGPTKDYSNQEEALVALNAFRNELDLPVPLLVNSGRGVHVYWALTESVILDDWIVVAERLKKLCAKHGLLADPAVTADAARVLRVPLTHNHKTNPPSEVNYFGYTNVEPVDFDEFSELIGNEPIPVPSKAEDFSEVVKNLIVNKESYFKDVLKKCPQMKHVWKNPEDVSEPLWFDAVSIVKHCADGGREGVHKISRNYSLYDPEETDRKYDTTKHVHRCSTINEHRSGVCETCTYWGKITSPIVLGQREKEGQAPDIPKYPPPYFRGANGGVYVRIKQDGETEEKLIYQNDLYVTKRIQDSEEGEGVVMRLHLPKDPLREFTLPLTAVTSREEFRKEMAKQGVAVPRMDEIMTYTVKWINELQATTEAQHARTQFGWTDEECTSFVLGNKEIFADREEDNPPSKATRDLFYAFEPRGTLDKWKELVEFYNRDKFELHQYIVATSFGSPLMALTPVACSGLHLLSTDSGVGKTTAMFVAAGVWGKPEELVIAESDTVASRMLRGEVYHNLPLYIDELTNAAPKDLSNMIYQLSGGKQRNRMAGGANLERSRGEPWSLLAVTTGNVSVIEKVSTAKAMPKAEAQRMMEHKVKKLFDDTASKELTDNHVANAITVYGHAGIIYIKYVLNNLDKVKELLAKVQRAIDKQAQLKAENRFWSAGVACTITGALIANKLGLINYDIKKLTSFALALLKENKNVVEDMGSTAQETVNNYVYENWGSILKIKSTDDLRKGQGNGLDDLVIPELDPKIKIIGRYETDTKMLYLLPKPLKAWLATQDANYSSFVQDVIATMNGKSNVLIRLTKGISTQLAPTRCLRIDCSGIDFNAAK